MAAKRAQVVAFGVAGVVVLALVGFSLRTPGPPRDTVVTPFTSAPTEAARPSSLWLGDSYTAGTGAKAPRLGEGCLTAEALGWICNLDAQGGTGFVADGHADSASNKPLIGRLPGTQAQFLADVILVDAGRNDSDQPTAAVRDAIGTYLAAVRKAWPEAKIVVIEPYYLGQAASPLKPAALDALRAEAKKVDGVLINPAGWADPTNADALLVTDKVHPNPAGHRYIADHLATDLRKLGPVPVTDSA